MRTRTMRWLVAALLVLGVLAWYGPADAFNYATLTGTGGRATAAAVVADTSAYVAVSQSAFTGLPANNAAVAGRIQVLIYNNATGTMNLSVSLQNNNFAGTWTAELQGTNAKTGTASYASVPHGSSARLYVNWSQTLVNTLGVSAGTYYANWQINGTSPTNVLLTHQDHWNLTAQFS